jgi:hypothetical protein
VCFFTESLALAILKIKYCGPQNDYKCTNIEQTMITCLFVNQQLKLPSRVCCNSKYKQEKLPYSASIEPADVLRDMPNGTLQFAII